MIFLAAPDDLVVDVRAGLHLHGLQHSLGTNGVKRPARHALELRSAFHSIMITDGQAGIRPSHKQQPHKNMPPSIGGGHGGAVPPAGAA